LLDFDVHLSTDPAAEQSNSEQYLKEACPTFFELPDNSFFRYNKTKKAWKRMSTKTCVTDFSVLFDSVINLKKLTFLCTQRGRKNRYEAAIIRETEI
jgi:hypothetical protein